MGRERNLEFGPAPDARRPASASPCQGEAMQGGLNACELRQRGEDVAADFAALQIAEQNHRELVGLEP